MFCSACRSHFCIHAAPHIYKPDWGKLTYRNRFEGAENTLVLDRSHGRGISRGARGQRFAAEQLGAKQTDDAAPYDLLVAGGTKVDVKTTYWGGALMVPVAQKYKLSPGRVDALLLVWDGREMRLAGQVGTAEFLSRHHTDGDFPVPTMHLWPFELEPIPEGWRA